MRWGRGALCSPTPQFFFAKASNSSKDSPKNLAALLYANSVKRWDAVKGIFRHTAKYYCSKKMLETIHMAASL